MAVMVNTTTTTTNEPPKRISALW